MTRQEWIKEREQIGWEYSCLCEEEANLRKKKEELAERLEQLDSYEPKN
jgi:hypothetical protein